MYRATAFLCRWAIPYALFCVLVRSSRLELANPFPPPTLHQESPGLNAIFESLEDKLQDAARSESSPWITNITSFSVAVTSTSETLWTTSYTAPILGNYSDGSPTPMTDQSYFRIASIGKVFTVLAILLQEKAGNCSLRDPITKHVPELKDRAGADTETIEWSSITLETLASQLSGIPRECKQFPSTMRTLLTRSTRRPKRLDRPAHGPRPPLRRPCQDWSTASW